MRISDQVISYEKKCKDALYSLLVKKIHPLLKDKKVGFPISIIVSDGACNIAVTEYEIGDDTCNIGYVTGKNYNNGKTIRTSTALLSLYDLGSVVDGLFFTMGMDRNVDIFSDIK